MTNNPETGFFKGEDIPIHIPTPPEVMAGSTHLGPGIDRNPTSPSLTFYPQNKEN